MLLEVWVLFGFQFLKYVFYTHSVNSEKCCILSLLIDCQVSQYSNIKYLIDWLLQLQGFQIAFMVILLIP